MKTTSMKKSRDLAVKRKAWKKIVHARSLYLNLVRQIMHDYDMFAVDPCLDLPVDSDVARAALANRARRASIAASVAAGNANCCETDDYDDWFVKNCLFTRSELEKARAKKD